MTTAQTIRQARLRAGLTQEMLAQRIGVTLSSVQRWEGGHATPRLRVRHLLSEQLGVEPDALSEDQDAAAERRLLEKIARRPLAEMSVPDFLLTLGALQESLAAAKNAKGPTPLLAGAGSGLDRREV